MMTLRDKYQNDSHFHALVDLMAAQIEQCNFTPSEMREAAILASIIYEENNLRSYVIVEEEMEGALRTIRRRLDETDGRSKCKHDWFLSEGYYHLCNKCGAKKI